MILVHLDYINIYLHREDILQQINDFLGGKIMAYSEKQLTLEWMPQIRFPNGNDVNLATIREAIQEQADENGIPVAFSEDQLKVGGLFSSEREDILIMYNPQHSYDYLRFLIRVMHQGKYAFMHVYNLGGSKNFGNDNAAAAGSMFKKITNAVGGHQAKLQAEENYYTILRDCLENVVGG